MRPSISLYAAVQQPPLRPTRLRQPALGLDHFLQRQRVLSLYRTILRTVYKIPPSATRDEMYTYARTEFERHRSVSDLTQIRYLISTGKTEFDGMKRYVDEMAGR